jgi:hypothetical protein
LPISNLTNLLFVETFDIGFARFAARMVLPQIVALAATYGLCRLRFRAELPARFDASRLGSPAAAVAHRGYFRASVSVLGVVFAGYFVAAFVHIEPYFVAFGGVAVLLGYGLSTGRVTPRLLLGLSWDLFPFVIGLFVVVRSVENLGVASAAAGWLRHHAGDPLTAMVASSAGTALAANATNNLPAALVAQSAIADAHAGEAAVYGALLGANIGPNVVPFGSIGCPQMFGGSLNLHVHVHTIAADGVFENTDAGGVRFHEAPPSSKDDVAEVAQRVRDRAVRWLRRRGHLDERAAEEFRNEVAEPSALDECMLLALAEPLRPLHLRSRLRSRPEGSPSPPLPSRPWCSSIRP